MSDRCTGHCCRAFSLPYSPSELTEMVRHEIACTNYEMQRSDIMVALLKTEETVIPKLLEDGKTISAEELERLREETINEQLGPDPRFTADAFGNRRALQVLQIADMVEYLGWRESPLPLAAWVADPQRSAHYYRCKNLTAEGNCGIYETRPMMCSGFPYGRPCSYAQCTWERAAEETSR